MVVVMYKGGGLTCLLGETVCTITLFSLKIGRFIVIIFSRLRGDKRAPLRTSCNSVLLVLKRLLSEQMDASAG